jgi:hypothetical protein
MNIIVCFSIAIDNMLADKNYIQYAWLAAAIMSLFALIMHYRKKKTLPQKGGPTLGT